MDIKDKVTQLEDEIKVLKNEVQAVLLDIRENYLNRENPFNPDASVPVIHQVTAAVTGQESFAVPAQLPRSVPGEDRKDGEPKEEQPSTEMEPENSLEQSYESELGGDDSELNNNEPELENNQKLAASEEIAHKEVKGVWRSEKEPLAQLKARRNKNASGEKIDLTTIAGLTQWVGDSVKKLGRERTEAILDISEMVGHVPPDLKKILVRFINRTPDESDGNPTTRDYIATLIQLESLLGMNSKSDELALLSILSQEVEL